MIIHAAAKKEAEEARREVEKLTLQEEVRRAERRFRQDEA